MRKPWRRRPRRFNRPKEVDTDVLTKLLDGVWDLPWDSSITRFPPGPYVDHWTNLVVQVDDERLALSSSDLVIALVTILRNGIDSDLNDLRAQVQQHYQVKSITTSTSSESMTAVLEFAIRLWSHTYPNLSSHQLPAGTLRQLIADHLPAKTPNQVIVEGKLSFDFCAKHLWRKAGMRIIWTDNLMEHLAMSRRNRSIYCFRHANMLSAVVSNSKIDPFPPGFARETLETLNLLFRPLSPGKTDFRVKQMEKHCDVDIELAMLQHGSLDLNGYRFWNERLQAIQAAYDSKTPSSLKQWWFDRRDREKWMSFWVATIVVVVFTFVFGIIQCITGILQVWVAYHPAG